LRCRCREGGVPDIDRAFWQKRWEAREREILEETAYRAVPAILAPLDTNSDTNVSGGGAVTDDEPIRITIPRDRDARPEADYWQALIDGEWVRVAGVRLVHEKPVAEKMSYSIAVEYVGQPSSSGSDAP
jgi:hypothetical protein